VDGTWNCADTAIGPCTCNEGFYTTATVTDCSLQRIRADCTNAGIDLFVAPYEGASFTGNIHVLTDSLTAATPGTHITTCTFAQDATDTHVYTLPGYGYTEQPANPPSTVDGSCPLPTFDNAGNTYTLYIYVQFTTLYTEADLEATIVCTRPADGTLETADVTVQGVDTPTLGTAIPVAQDIVTGTTFEIFATGTTATNLAGTVDLLPATAIAAGTDVDLVFTMARGQIYDNVGVVTITAYNYPPASTPPGDGSEITFELMTDGCVPLAAGRICSSVTKANDPADANNIRIVYTMKAFTMPNQVTGSTNTVPVVYFRAALCPIAVGSTTDACNPNSRSDCTGGSFAQSISYVDNLLTVVAPPARKRRQASISSATENEVRPIDVALLVQDRRLITVEQTPGRSEDNTSECYESLTFILPLVLLSVVLVFAIIMAMFFCVKLSRSRDSHMEGATNMAYKS